MLSLFLLFIGSVEGRMANGDLNQLVDFMLDKNKDVHQDFRLSVNETVRLALDGLLDRIKCVQQGLTHMQCVQCLRPAKVLSILNPDSQPTVTNHLDLEHLSVILLNHALNFRTACHSPTNVEKKSTCNSYATCRAQLWQRLPVGETGQQPGKLLEEVENVLREIKAFYEPLSAQKCFSAENVLAEMPKSGVGEKPHLEHLTTLLVGHLLNGECIDVGEAVTDFIEDIFLHYGDRCNRIITQPGFEKLMNDLKSQDHKDHADHGMPENSCTQTVIKEELEQNRRKHTVDLITMTEVEGLPKELLEASIYNMKEVRKRSTRGTFQTLTISPDKHEHRSLASECISADGLLRRFSLAPSQTITPIQFLQLCPALVQQVVSGVCNYGVNSTVTSQLAKPTDNELYGYSTLAVFVISLTSLCGVFIFPLLGKSSYKYIMMGFIGLSFGTMAGDALLHLLPQALGLHNHEESENEAQENHKSVSETIPTYLWQQLGILATIYLLFLFEAISNVFSGDGDENGHGHSHVPDKLPEGMTMKTIKGQNGHKPTSETSNSPGALESGENLDKTAEPVIKSTKLFCGLTTMACVIIIGDTLHNFGDGLAIGASFAPGIRGGISTSLAVFCHELPHEFGDFVLLLSTGLSFGKALLVNFISALFCFVGLYIGIQLGDDLTTRKWILTATAGIFLYVALTEMLPELKSNKDGKPWKMFLVKNLGIFAGVGIMIIIAIYEDHFHF